jgi:aminoglycoside phosphotransferase (APT) family kinase protein
MKITNNQIKQICEKLKEEFVEIKFLSRGNHNESYFLKTKNKNLVLRIENNHQFKNLKNEYIFLKKINGKFAPKVYLFDNSNKIISKDYLVEDFIEGKHPERKVDNNFIKVMALWYKKLHSNKSVISLKESKNKNLLNQLIQYNKNIIKYKNHVSKEVWNEYFKLFEKIKLFFEKNNKLLNRRKYFSMVHGDPTRSNVFYDKNSVKLIDWEFVRYDYPETDLVFFFYSYDLTKKQWKFFLNTYGYSNSQVANKILNLFFIDHYIGMINWRFERLHYISIGKADLKQNASNKNKMITEIKEDLEKIKNIVKNN